MSFREQLTELICKAFHEHQDKVRKGTKVELAAEELTAELLKFAESVLVGEKGAALWNAAHTVAKGAGNAAGTVASAVWSELWGNPAAMLLPAGNIKVALKALENEGTYLKRWADDPTFRSRMDVPWKQALAERLTPQLVAQRLAEVCFTAISVRTACQRELARLPFGTSEQDMFGMFGMFVSADDHPSAATPTGQPVETTSQTAEAVSRGGALALPERTVAARPPLLTADSLLIARKGRYRNDHAKLSQVRRQMLWLAHLVEDGAHVHYEKIEESGPGGLAFNPHTVRSVASTVSYMVVPNILCTCAMLACSAAAQTGKAARNAAVRTQSEGER